MTREEAIKQIREDICCEKPIQHYCRDGCMHGKEQCAYSLAIEALGNDTNVGGKLEKTEKFNRMIEAFECDFSLIQQGEKTFAQLDENLKVEKVNVNSLRKDMDLMQELSYLIRHGKAEIWLKEGE